jgi:hypothetical protein
VDATEGACEIVFRRRRAMTSVLDQEERRDTLDREGTGSGHVIDENR